MKEGGFELEEARDQLAVLRPDARRPHIVAALQGRDTELLEVEVVAEQRLPFLEDRVHHRLVLFEAGPVQRVVAVHETTVQQADDPQLLEGVRVVMSRSEPSREPHPHALVKGRLDAPIEPCRGLAAVVPRVVVGHPPALHLVHADLADLLPVLDADPLAVARDHHVGRTRVDNFLTRVARDVAGQPLGHLLGLHDERLDGHDVLVTLHCAHAVCFQVSQVVDPVLARLAVLQVEDLQHAVALNLRDEADGHKVVGFHVDLVARGEFAEHLALGPHELVADRLGYLLDPVVNENPLPTPVVGRRLGEPTGE